MFPIPWYVVLLVSIPESFLVIVLGFTLFSLKISFKKALLIAIISSLACYLIRLFNTINGFQTLVWSTVMLIFCLLLTRNYVWKVVAAILAGVSISGVIVSVYSPSFFCLTSTTVADLQTKPWLNIYFFLPEAILMTLLYIVVNRFHMSFYNEPAGGINNETF